MNNFENTITQNAQCQPLNLSERWVANGDLQRVKMVESGGNGVESDLSLEDIEPIQLGVEMTVEGGISNLITVIEVGDDIMLGILDKKPQEGFGEDFENDSERFILADVQVAPDLHRNPVFKIATKHDGEHLKAEFINEPDTTTILGHNRRSRVIDKLDIEVHDPNMAKDQLRFRFVAGGFLHIEAAGNGSDVSILARPKSDPDRTLSPKEILDLQGMSGTKNASNGTSVIDSKLETEIGKNENGSEKIEPLDEFNLGNSRAVYLGRVELNINNGGYVFETTDEEGANRRFFVYKSNSDGGWRVSQGIEQYQKDGKTRIRYLKGPENKFSSQYTQDTKLTPVFEEIVNKLQTQGDGGNSALIRSAVEVPDQDIDAALDDFEDGVNTFNLLQSDAALETISLLRAGNLITEHLRGVFNLPESATDAEVESILLEQVNVVNNDLLNSNIIPDLSTPVHISNDEHPQLGKVIREFFIKKIGKHEQQWVFAHDDSGRVWIDRIRYVDSKVTPYGTDAEMLDSGFLTSKPLDYSDQVTAVPESLRNPFGSTGYTDISRFLDLFEPIIRYRKQRGVIRI